MERFKNLLESLNSKTAVAFRVISESIQTKAVSRSSLESAYQRVCGKYDITRSEAQVLALMLSGAITTGWLRVDLQIQLGMSSEESSSVWHNLKTKDYVKGDYYAMEGRTLTETFAYSLVYEIPIVLAGIFSLSDMAYSIATGKPSINGEGYDDSSSYRIRKGMFPALEKMRKHGMSCGRLGDGCLSYNGMLSSFIFIGQFLRNFLVPLCIEDLSNVNSKKMVRDAIGELVKNEIIVRVPASEKSDGVKKEQYRISPSFAGMFKDMDVVLDMSALSEFGTYVNSESIEEKALIFNESDTKAMDRLSRAAEAEYYEDIMAGLRKHGKRTCLSAILSGAPGTGKTELARQIARKTGRGLWVVDSAKLFGSFWGESEKNFRNLFQTYRYVCAVSKTCPILFLDEADGILCRRTENVGSGISRSENVVQNIILEELNTLPGLVFATTNLLQNLDEALKRRFTFKLSFHLPDETTSIRIWMTRFPSLSEEEAAIISQRYSLSPGMIDNIESQSIIDSVLDGTEVGFHELISYCEEFSEGASHVRIGF